MKLLSTNTLAKLRRGAENLYRKNRDKLPTATVTIRQDVANDLGLATKDVEAEPIKTSSVERVGLFDDEPITPSVIPTVMANVKLIDYIEALKNYKPDDQSEKTTTVANSNPGQSVKS